MSYDPDAWEVPDEGDVERAHPVLDPQALLNQLIADTPGATRRAPQERMVQAIFDGLRRGEHVAIQAGTGTGKSYGYLVAGVASGSRIVVSTSTKSLGEQLTTKDVPRVAAAAAKLGRDVKVALLKGRANYLCMHRLDETLNLAQGTLDVGPATDTANETGQQVTSIIEWARTTETGDRTEAPPVTDRIWAQFATDGASCPGSKACPFGKECFAEAAKRRAYAADIAVVNHALLANYLSLQAGSIPTPLTEFDVLIADEAHDLEANVSKAWSYEVDPRRITRALAAAKRLGEKYTSEIERITTSAKTLEVALAALPDGELTDLPAEAVGTITSIADGLRGLGRAAKTNSETAEGSAKTGWVMLSQRLNNGAGDLLDTLSINRELYVQSVQRGRDDSVTLTTEPLSIADRFPDAIKDWQVVLASATLTVAGRFEPITNALGISATGTDVGSPFNYRKQVMLYVPDRTFPAPVGSSEARREHTIAVQETLERLVEAAGGRTLGLFTTTKAAREAADRLRARFPGLNILGHGDAPMGQLVDEFREDETSVLLGTRGLWQGVDVQGASCSVVLIDKIPFPMFNDPLMSARKRKVDQAGGRGFDEVMVAYAAIALAQGAGRLIRTAADRGLIAVMDPRLRTKYYGRALMRSLPAVYAHDDLDVACDALARLTSTAVDLAA